MATTVPESAVGAVQDPSTRVLARFTAAPSMTEEKYDETINRLQAVDSQWPPEGLAYHIAFSSGGSFRVSEIWDSREQLDAHAQTLMPVLTDVGVELEGEPEILEIYNIIQR
jgi:quinol monooxygenase YgiN